MKKLLSTLLCALLCLAALPSFAEEEPVYLRDIEREFSITLSTVTNILQLM